MKLPASTLYTGSTLPAQIFSLAHIRHFVLEYHTLIINVDYPNS